MPACVVDPRPEGVPGHHRPGGVVRIAEIEEVHRAVGERRAEAILGRGREIEKPGVPAVSAGGARPSCHGVRVDVGGVHGVDERHLRVGREDLLDVAGVALGAVAHEDLVGPDPDAARTVVVGGDELGQELVARLGPVAPERLGPRHLVDGLVHGAHNRRGQRQRDVADPEPDQPGVRMGGRKRLHAPRDLGEEVGRLQREVVLVDPDHDRLPGVRWLVDGILASVDGPGTMADDADRIPPRRRSHHAHYEEAVCRRALAGAMELVRRPAGPGRGHARPSRRACRGGPALQGLASRPPSPARTGSPPAATSLPELFARGTLVVVTGTNGKSTTAHLVEQTLARAGKLGRTATAATWSRDHAALSRSPPCIGRSLEVDRNAPVRDTAGRPAVLVVTNVFRDQLPAMER